MQSNTDLQPASPSSKTDNIATAIEDSQLLLQYAAESGVAIDEHDLSVLIDSKFSYREGTLNAESEHLFWRSFTNVTHAVKPVTIQSLKAVHQSPKKNKRIGGNIDKVVSRYRVLAVVSLLALLVIQIYLIIGVTAKTKSNELFDQKEDIKAKIKEVIALKQLTDEGAGDDPNVITLQDQYEEIEQKQDANYELLRSWNKVWLALFLKNEFEGKLRRYRETEYESQVAILEEKIARLEASIQSQSEDADSTAQDQIAQHERLAILQEELREKQLQREHDITRNRFFLNTFSSEYVTVALERYLLPLLYGLLGAVFYVLRTLSRELQDLTYLPMTEINYRLRIPTGALAGLTISWFFTGGNLGSGLSGFAVSFLTGYNVEVLFFLMDKIISQFTSKDSGPEPASSQSQSANKDSGSESIPSQSQSASKDSQKP